MLLPIDSLLSHSGHPRYISYVYKGHLTTLVNDVSRRKAGRQRCFTPSKICLGTMLYGESLSEGEAFEQMSLASDGGVTTFDSAEMYPVPQREATQGLSEQFLGNWLKSGGRRREEYTIATKATGPSGQMTWIRGGPQSLDRGNIMSAIEGSLDRLQTDYIDLYQLHWPDRYVPMFGEVEYDPSRAYSFIPLAEQLETLGDAVRQGKIRHIGLSNETPWGLMECLRLAKADAALPKVVAIQNAYSLLCRTFETGLAEICHMEGVGLLAYSPLAMGLLTGKYLSPGGGPRQARLNKYKGRYAEAESRYGPKPNVQAAVEAYVALAHAAGISPTELAIRFVNSRPYVSSAVVGATSTEQLNELLIAVEKGPLDEDLLDAVDHVHRRMPSPTP